MALGTFEPQGYFQAPLAEKLVEDLLYSIKHDRVDAEACRAELHSRGWKDQWIADRVG